MNTVSNVLDIDFAKLQQQTIKQLKPKYKALLQHNQDPDMAYANSYEQAVALIAEATCVSQAKTKFKERILLQKIMQEVSQ